MNKSDQLKHITSARIRFGDTDLVPDVSGALWAGEFKTLLVADLHFEKASSFAERGAFLPPYDTRTSLRLLQKVCNFFQPKHVISLGDSFHDVRARSRMGEDVISELRAFTSTYEVTWITGNHDETPPVDLGGHIADHTKLGSITLRHIPGGGSPLFPEIAGHLHPVAVVAQRGRRLRKRCFIGDQCRLIMPAFGALTGGLDVRSEAFESIFKDGEFNAWLLGRDKVYPFSSKRLRAAV